MLIKPRGEPMKTQAIVTAATLTLAAQSAQAWTLDKDVDDLTDEYSVHAYNDEEESGHTAQWIAISCFSGKRMQAKISFNEFLNSAHEHASIKYRVDKGKLVKPSGWKISTQHDTAYATDIRAVNFAKNLLTGSKIVAEAIAHDGDKHRIRVSLLGAAKPIRAVLKECN